MGYTQHMSLISQGILSETFHLFRADFYELTEFLKIIRSTRNPYLGKIFKSKGTTLPFLWTVIIVPFQAYLAEYNSQ